MKIQELRTKTKEELTKRLEKKRQEYDEIIFDIKTAQETNYSSKGKLQKEIARIMTLLNDNKYEPVKVEKKIEKKSEKTESKPKKETK
ncbi:MAG TPA: 50S ribosomal protein L29 [Candidatus Dojkabacteria bacterium]|jgi:ribosomal protein L29